ncbi:ParB/RepB/Spo0J family partition protein [uncultured Selenomonas sp.]|uniref:ParB/RepB/Spo0J family partition protein n=1 Tax=uncultured Selenomonas sp. TaxID=159275 RepID=UPI002588F4E2|nr:ParB/RepB/Spo0J family partition protein [uncultured Selenomonas sp.]
MKKYNGSMMAYLNERTQGAAAAETSNRREVQMIDFHQLIPNTKNFYGIREIEQLAHSMALSGTVEPLLVVRRDDGNYNIISGERRFRAVSLRYERGELTSPDVPCLVHEAFSGDGKLTAEMRENIAIVCANSYRQKTALEKLEEINVLEPIAKIYYMDALTNGSFSGAFRKYFAEQFLGMSSTSLQRLLVLRKLCPEAREALQDGTISDTLASVLANRATEEQQDYLRRLAFGEVQGTVKELVESYRDTSSEAAESEEPVGDGREQLGTKMMEGGAQMDDAAGAKEPSATGASSDWRLTADPDDPPTVPEQPDEAETEREEQPPAPSEADWERHGQEKLFDTPVPQNLTPEEAESEANNWLEQCLKSVAEMAAQKAETARQDGNKRLAAQWEVRKAAVNFVIETIK